MIPAGEYFELPDHELDTFVVSVGIFSVLLGLGFCLIYGWLIKRLVSEEVKLEFSV
jgi:hypothetical protein